MSGSRPAPTMNVEDSASTDNPIEKGKSTGKGKFPKSGGKGGKNKSSRSDTSSLKTESSSTKSTPGFAEGNNVLQSYGLSVSGRKERILSPFKADKFFHFVNQSYTRLIQAKPGLPYRFTLAEFRHVAALQLYHRIESVKFEALGIKPSAPTRIPLPRNTRVFQPLWSVLANIGTVDDDELRAVYIPDGILPDSDDLDSTHDIEGLLSCTLYDWRTSWEDVKRARGQRKPLQTREGHSDNQESNEFSSLDKKAMFEKIGSLRRNILAAQAKLDSGQSKILDGSLYHFPLWQSPKDKDKSSPPSGSVSAGGQVYDTSVSDSDLKKTKRFYTPADYESQLERLFDAARLKKKELTTPSFDVSYSIEAYRVADGTIDANPGAYGARLHWDPQLWLDYEQFVEELSPVAMFSLSMPSETTGTYAWVLPVEKREDDDSSVWAVMPKASIPPVTWTLALLLQSSTLSKDRRSTFYVETDRLQNVLGLRQRYISAAVKAPAPTEQYGTY